MTKIGDIINYRDGSGTFFNTIDSASGGSSGDQAEGEGDKKISGDKSGDGADGQKAYSDDRGPILSS